MTIHQFLRNFPNFIEFSRRSKILLLSYYLRQYHGLIEFSSSNIKDCCQGIVKPPSQLPQQLDLLSKGRDSALMKGSKRGFYSLTISGITEVDNYLLADNKAEAIIDKLISDAIPYLKKVISKVSVENQRIFMAESISCLHVDARRATIIMTWSGAIGHLYDYIIMHKLVEFNDALHNRNDRHSNLTISNKDDFSDIKDSVFLETCRSAHIITNDVRKILDEKLGIRNTCAHPSNIEVHPSKVVNFVEDLIDNVILKYPM